MKDRMGGRFTKTMLSCSTLVLIKGFLYVFVVVRWGEILENRQKERAIDNITEHNINGGSAGEEIKT